VAPLVKRSKGRKGWRKPTNGLIILGEKKRTGKGGTPSMGRGGGVSQGRGGVGGVGKRGKTERRR